MEEKNYNVSIDFRKQAERIISSVQSLIENDGIDFKNGLDIRVNGDYWSVEKASLELIRIVVSSEDGTREIISKDDELIINQIK